MRALILDSFSYAEQHLMHLHYCKGRFRVGVGVFFNKTQSNRNNLPVFIYFFNTVQSTERVTRKKYH